MAVSTLAQKIEASSLTFDDLERDYRPMLALVNELIGVVPNCDLVLEIWPPGFRTYNLFVPNLLNLPASLWGQGAPKDLVGLAMYTSSRAAECMYCSAHTCSFALRRGATPDALVGTYNETERAVANLAEAISAVPAYLTRDHIDAAARHLSHSEIEWIVMSVAMMGFLNKFMDTMGIELEEAAIHDVADLIGPTGWQVGKHGWSTELDDDQLEGRTLTPAGNGAVDGTDATAEPGYRSVPVDSLGTYLRVLRQAPAAIRKDRQWTKGLSGRLGAALIDLESQVGYSFPILAGIGKNRPVRAIAAALRENLDPSLTVVGLDVKCLVGLVYAEVVGNDMLRAEAVQLAELLAPEISPNMLVAVSRFAAGESISAVLPPGLTRKQAAAVMLAKVGSPSPSEVNEITIEMAAESLTPAEIVEIVVWISVQQLLHRLYVFYGALNGTDD